ncbi:MAG: ATP-binding protein [Rivularia sp. (in: Bacteria)]|nr:ATP-binding protein [Rivularia sp. MS3]
MTTQPDYSKIYTHAPEQHPNLILGSLQLLFWMFFRPTAFKNHLQRIEPRLLKSKTQNHKSIQWKNPNLLRLLIQLFLILPILVKFGAILFVLILGKSLDKVILGAIYDLLGGIFAALIVGIIFSLLESKFSNDNSSILSGIGCGITYGALTALITSLVGSNMIQNNSLILIVLAIIGMNITTNIPRHGLSLIILFFISLMLAYLMWETWTLSPVSVDFQYQRVRLQRRIIFYSNLGLFSSIGLWLPLITYPFQAIWNNIIYEIDKDKTTTQATLLRYNSVFWDELQYLKFKNLQDYILLVAKRNRLEADAAIEYLINSPLRWVGQAIKIELDAIYLEKCTSLEDISNAYDELIISEAEGSASIVIRIFNRTSEDVKTHLNYSTNYRKRLVLKTVLENLDKNLQDLSRSQHKYAPRFYPIARKWRDIISNHIEQLAKETELRQEIDSPYIIGVPLTLQQQIFIGRDDIGSRIEQLLLDRRRPPLLLYGQKRMGKTSLLNNLGKLLHNSIIQMFVDLQGTPSKAKDSTGFLYNLARGMINSAKLQSALTLPPLTRETLENDPFTNFDEWLDKVEETLEQNTALLMLDEFEALDKAISKGRFDEEDVLGILRHLIQHRPKFKVLIAGSHTIEEYQRWASYLINVQVVKVSYLLEHEARQLIEHPIKDFKLRYEPDAVERILQLTRCHPFLVQLMCSELVALKNEQDPSVRRLATLADVEAAIPEALKAGSLFFADINNQVNTTGLEILRFIAAKGEKAVVSEKTMALEFQNTDYSNAMRLLLQRELIEEVNSRYCFQVELIRRWFEKSNI